VASIPSGDDVNDPLLVLVDVAPDQGQRLIDRSRPRQQRLPLMMVAMDGQLLVALPALHGSHRAAQVRRNFLPRVEAPSR